MTKYQEYSIKSKLFQKIEIISLYIVEGEWEKWNGELNFQELWDLINFSETLITWREIELIYY